MHPCHVLVCMTLEGPITHMEFSYFRICALLTKCAYFVYLVGIETEHLSLCPGFTLQMPTIARLKPKPGISIQVSPMGCRDADTWSHWLLPCRVGYKEVRLGAKA